jgi:hypothetical protein
MGDDEQKRRKEKFEELPFCCCLGVGALKVIDAKSVACISPTFSFLS